MQLMGVEFAPLQVPLRRRLQTLAAAAWFVTLAFGGFIAIGVAVHVVLFTSWRWPMIAYLAWIWLVDKDTCEKGGRSNEWVKNWIWWKYLKEYFPFNLHRLPWVELDPKKNYLFCCFPHGMLSTGSFNAFGTNYGGFHDYFPNHTCHVVTLSQHYHVPFFREFCLSLGGIASSAKSIDYILKYPEGGHVCILMVGGAAEAYYCMPGQYRVILKNRKGFIKLALKNGTPLVPVLSFGETDLFTQIDGEVHSTFRKFQESFRKLFGMAPIIPIGRGFFQYSFGIIPKRQPITTVVGKPIPVEKIEDPTKEEIDALHEKFMKHLEEMFEEQKYNYLDKPEEKKLIIE